MDKALVVSNYNTELDWLKETYSHGFSYENTFIYDKSDREIDFNRLGWVTKVPNYGANQYDYISFIIDYYDNLPKMSYFIKGNMFSKHENYYTTRERFAQMLDSEELFSGWQDKQLLVGDSFVMSVPLLLKYFRMVDSDNQSLGVVLVAIQYYGKIGIIADHTNTCQ